MLAVIRKISDKLIVRILLALIAFSFVGWGIKDVLQGTHNSNIVTFSHAKNITANDFLKAKSEEISIIQRQNGTNLSEEQMKQLDINNFIVQRLINDRILNYLSDYYDLDLSPNMVGELIKNSPHFKDERGEFDIRLFKAAFRNSYQKEEEYLQNIKEKALKDMVISIFLQSFKTPEVMINNVINYMADTRIVDLVQMDLKTTTTALSLAKSTSEQLQQFYQNNKALFTLPELRSFSYIKVAPSFMQQRVEITGQELQEFYNENKEMLGEKNFEETKAEITELLKQQKLDELILEFAKNLEDNVAAGSSLKEIAEKYTLPVLTIENASREEIMSNYPEIAEITETIFEITEGELSYPVELQNSAGIILMQLNSITPGTLEALDKVQLKAEKLWREEKLKELNFKIIQDLAQSYQAGNSSANEYAKIPVKISAGVSFTRAELEEGDNVHLPPALLLSIFQVKQGTTTPVFKMNDKAYFAYVKSIEIDSQTINKVKNSSEEKIANTIKYSVFDELIAYLLQLNNAKVNYQNPVLKE